MQFESNKEGHLRLRGKPYGRAKKDCVLIIYYYIHIQTWFNINHHAFQPLPAMCVGHARTYTHTHTPLRKQVSLSAPLPTGER